VNRRWNAREREQERAHNARLGAVMGLDLVDVVHDNRTGLDYHPACGFHLDTRDAVELGALAGEKTCAGCHQAI